MAKKANIPYICIERPDTGAIIDILDGPCACMVEVKLHDKGATLEVCVTMADGEVVIWQTVKRSE